ncbi:hypothetical protein L0657_21330 [Dyadobacter sp. CY345]|uniref:hypothetical protein n=1 Tax=Dyadobacter sp. CY345 TaxID=2909335 RepID=UPI001F3B3725|nr:hypothetical protein [Dyadobacter sp. CY345]MCF2446513.1 hypothetical protein [Dyadobacter sp. CY345]
MPAIIVKPIEHLTRIVVKIMLTANFNSISALKYYYDDPERDTYNKFGACICRIDFRYS